MGTLGGTCEIIEEEEGFGPNLKETYGKNHLVNPGQKCSIEDDINHLFEAIDIRNSMKGKDASRKSALKKPIRVGSPASGIGISESASLKQALRGLCISQASEMAAMKRLSKPAALSGPSEAGTIKRLYRTVVVEAGDSVIPLNEGKRNLEVSLIPEISTAELFEKTPQSVQFQTAESFQTVESLYRTASTSAAADAEAPSANFVQKCNLKSAESAHTGKYAMELNKNIFSSVELSDRTSVSDNGRKGKLPSSSDLSSSTNGTNKAGGSGPQALRARNFVNKQVNKISAVSSRNRKSCTKICDNVMGPSTGKSGCETSGCTLENHSKENRNASTSSSCSFAESSVMDAGASKQSSDHCNRIATLVAKVEDRLAREKAEFSQSSKSSIGDYSSSTTISEESSVSLSSRSGNRPHMSKDLRWKAIRHVQKQHGSLSMRNLKLLKKLGCGDIGTVYLAELISTNCLFALKVMDIEFLVSRKKMARAQTEREIMQMLDHPFLPTLYSHFATDKLSCLLMEYCPGGDLHVLRQKQPGRSFSEEAARFYVAEVLLALEYLHMLGVVYRDLKPENILVREDGHIMLTDFDLSLRCAVNPTLVKSSPSVSDPPKKISSPCTDSSCIDPFCLQPSWQVSCFTPRLLSAAAKSRKLKSDLAAQVNPLPQLIVEPTTARSNSFVGTHEYLAPEIIKGEGHGNAVDWWTYGIFLYELLYGKTPFKGSGNEETLLNVVSQSLKFPGSPIVSFYARDLIRGLLVKEPENRLGSIKGAAEIRQHPFFEGLNWALIRCAIPPELPKFDDVGMEASQKENTKSMKGSTDTREGLAFEVF